MNDNIIEFKTKEEMYEEARAMLELPEKASEGYSKMKKLADSGYDRAVYVVARCLSEGTGVEKNQSAAFGLMFEYAYDCEQPRAYMTLGKYYEDGIGTEKNEQNAVTLYKTATDYYYPPAFIELARCYRKGIFVPVNQKKAFALDMMAANFDYCLGMFHVALHYINGDGVERDPRMAYYWLTKASDAGSTQATKMLHEIQMRRAEREKITAK